MSFVFDKTQVCHDSTIMLNVMRDVTANPANSRAWITSVGDSPMNQVLRRVGHCQSHIAAFSQQYGWCAYVGTRERLIKRYDKECDGKRDDW